MTSFLSIIIDCNAYNWGLAASKYGPSTVGDVIAAIAALCNAQIFTSLSNRLLLIAEGIEKKEKKLFTNERVKRNRNADGEDENFSATIEELLRRALLTNADTSKNGTTDNFSSSVSLSICGKQF